MIYPLSGLSKKAGYDEKFDEYERMHRKLFPNSYQTTNGPYEFRRHMWRQGEKFFNSPKGQELFKRWTDGLITPKTQQPAPTPTPTPTSQNNPLGGLPKKYGMAAGLAIGLGGKYVQPQQPNLWQKAVVSPIKSLFTGPAYK